MPRKIRATLQRSLAPSCLALTLVSLSAGCGAPPKQPPAFMDPPIHCNADLVRGISQQLVTKQLVLPASSNTTYSEDFDGNGRTENQLKNLISIASLVGIDLAAILQERNLAGRDLLLLDLVTTDLQQADCASLTIRHPAAPDPAAPPKFDGSDVFQSDDAATVTLYGRIDDFVFQSVRARDQETAAEAAFRLTLQWPIAAQQTVAMPLRAVGVRARLQTDMQRRLTGLQAGMLTGVLPAGSLGDTLVPALAQVLTDAIRSDRDVDHQKALIGLFESATSALSEAKCMVAADCCRLAPTTCRILPAEVTAAPVGGVVAPDVEVFDSGGAWHPVPGGRKYNGFSVGLGFEAVRATF